MDVGPHYVVSNYEYSSVAKSSPFKCSTFSSETFWSVAQRLLNTIWGNCLLSASKIKTFLGGRFSVDAAIDLSWNGLFIDFHFLS